jgi:hypothetical protein
MPYEPSNYAPTWVEWSIMLAGFALFALLITVFVKVFPILAVWEIAEEQERRRGRSRGDRRLKRFGRNRRRKHEFHGIEGCGRAVVAALGFLAVTVPAEADHTAAVLSVPGQVAVGEKVEVSVRVSEAETASPGQVSQGQALPGTTVTFYTTESFGGVTGKVEIGRAVTDATGVAAIGTSLGQPATTRSARSTWLAVRGGREPARSSPWPASARPSFTTLAAGFRSRA